MSTHGHQARLPGILVDYWRGSLCFVLGLTLFASLMLACSPFGARSQVGEQLYLVEKRLVYSTLPERRARLLGSIPKRSFYLRILWVFFSVFLYTCSREHHFPTVDVSFGH